MAQQAAARLLSQRPLRSSRPAMGKQAEAEQRHTQQTPSERTALRGQTRPQGAEHEALFRKSREDGCPMAMFWVQGTELDHQTGLQIMPKGQASRAHTPKANTTTLGEWCQQDCPAHLLCRGGQRQRTKPRRTRRRSKKKPSPCSRPSTTWVDKSWNGHQPNELIDESFNAFLGARECEVKSRVRAIPFVQ